MVVLQGETRITARVLPKPAKRKSNHQLPIPSFEIRGKDRILYLLLLRPMLLQFGAAVAAAELL